ncbi:LuxR family transcriptional regulator [Streptomyces sp. NPDC046197]|uniref:helix-turn-helix transcriptional regulator n=1 Tax=Streptomyces sp. NPDC046197 TaxID=3154337 RepID=UPI0033D2512B
MTSAGLHGRETEMARLIALIESAAAGIPAVVVVRGEPGIGKSALLGAFGRLAADTGFQVGAAPVRRTPDRPLATAEVALTSLESTHRARTGAESPPAARLLDELLDRFAAHTARGPVLLCLDDAPRMDEWSTRWLRAVSEAEWPSPSIIALSETAVDVGLGQPPVGELAWRAEQLDLGGLSPAALVQLAAARQKTALGEESAAVCHELTGGNPRLLLSLLDGHAGGAPTAGELRAAGERAALPGSARWLGGLGPDALALAQAVAVLDQDAEISLAAQLAELTPEQTLPPLDELVRHGVLANRTPLTFRHPLLGNMVRGAIPVGSRTALHLRAAEILRDGHFDATKVARHLMAAGPMDLNWTLRPLMAAARRLARAGRAEEAAQHLRRVLREKLPPRVRSAVRCELAELDEFVDPSGTERRLEEARAEAGDPESVTGCAMALAGLLARGGRPADAVAVLDDTAGQLGADAAAQVWRLRAHKEFICLDGPGWLSRALKPPYELTGSRPATPEAGRELAALRAARAVADGAGRMTAVRQARIALAGGRERTQRCVWHGCTALIHADELAEAWTHCSGLRPVAGALPGRWEHVTAELLRGRICRIRGDLHGVLDALAPLTGLLGAAAGRGHLLGALGIAALVEAHALRGDADTALGLLADCGLDGDVPVRQDTVTVLVARAVARESAGDLAVAVQDCLAAGRLLADCGVRNPAVAPWRSHAARMLTALEQPAQAARLAAAELADALRWGTPRTVGTARHALAVANSATSGEPDDSNDSNDSRDSDHADGTDAVAAAVDLLAASPARLELAVARLDLGVALSGAGRHDAARRELAAALALAEACGARPLAERIRTARKQADAAGAEPGLERLLAVLTPQELKILVLAREGYTNREISKRLFVTVRTVEFHLSGAYRKLGISGRRQLPEIVPSAARPARP